jgi:hypothetical protein
LLLLDTDCLSAAVIDGVTIGHPCCSVLNCSIPLAKQKDKFCPQHALMAGVCHIDGCTSSAETGHKTCGEETHRALEIQAEKRGQGMFQLVHRLKRIRMSSVNDEEARLLDPMLDLAESSETSGKTQSKNKLTAKFSRNWSHNEQLCVKPCGVIVSRATFMGSEGIHDVGVSQYVATQGIRTRPLYIGVYSTYLSEEVSQGNAVIHIL